MFRNSVTSVKTYGADIKSHHNPLVTTVSLKLKKVQQTKPMEYDLR